MQALVACLESCLQIPDGAIRCTAVEGYRLDVGADSDDSLRQGVEACTAVIGVLTRQSLASGYVIMELGAAWGLKKATYPLVADDVEFASIPDPIRRKHAARISNVGDVTGLVKAIENTCGFAARNDEKRAAAINELVRCSQLEIPTRSSVILGAFRRYRITIGGLGAVGLLLAIVLPSTRHFANALTFPFRSVASSSGTAASSSIATDRDDLSDVSAALQTVQPILEVSDALMSDRQALREYLVFLETYRAIELAAASELQVSNRATVVQFLDSNDVTLIENGPSVLALHMDAQRYEGNDMRDSRIANLRHFAQALVLPEDTHDGQRIMAEIQACVRVERAFGKSLSVPGPWPQSLFFYDFVSRHGHPQLSNTLSIARAISMRSIANAIDAMEKFCEGSSIEQSECSPNTIGRKL